jgi:PAS domain-containing protein
MAQGWADDRAPRSAFQEDGSGAIDRDLRYRFVSATYERWFARSKEELLGSRVEDVIGEAAYQTVGPYIERALSGEAVTCDGEITYFGDQKRFIRSDLRPAARRGSERLRFRGARV